jgi:putative ABC transport system permease protein
VREIDPNLAVSEVATMASLRSTSVARERFLMRLLSIFAAAGLFLATVGMYGVLAQLARRQVREMGIRMALGAQAKQVQWLVVRQGVRLLVAGLIAGTAAALFATRAMQSLLFEIRPGDPTTYASAIAILAVAAGLASWIPARRASRADPARVLRAE